MRLAQIGAIVICIAGAIAIALVWNAAPTDPAPASQSAEPAPVAYNGAMVETDGPVSYFMDRCSRCHGQVENAYGGIPTLKRGDALKETIHDMAEQRAMAPLDEAGVEQQYTLHLAIIDKTPFVWIDPAQKDILAGEVMAGSSVILKTADESIAARVKGNTFFLPRQSGKLIVTRNKKRVEVDVP
jgi:hypothetical protein